MKDEQKWEIVFLYKQKSHTLRAIAKKMKCTVSTVHHIISNYRDTGQVSPPKHSGRPSIINDDTQKFLDRLINQNDTATSSELARIVQQKTGRRVSSRTIQRVRRGPLARHPVHEVITKLISR